MRSALLPGLGDPSDEGTLLHLLELLYETGRVDLPLGRLFEGHVDALQIVQRYGTAAQGRRVEAILAGGGAFGVWNADLAGQPLRLADGRLTGGESFASGAGLPHALVTVDGEGGRQLMLLNLARTPPVVDRSFWHVIGMQRSETHVVRWMEAPVATDDLIGAPGDYVREPWFSGGALRFATAGRRHRRTARPYHRASRGVGQGGRPAPEGSTCRALRLGGGDGGGGAHRCGGLVRRHRRAPAAGRRRAGGGLRCRRTGDRTRRAGGGVRVVVRRAPARRGHHRPVGVPPPARTRRAADAGGRGGGGRYVDGRIVKLRLGTPRRLLVVAPHPDDEAIGAHTMMTRLRRRGVVVHVVIVTDGAGSHRSSPRWPGRRLVAERRRESRRVLRQIGVTADAVTFLDLPDGRLDTRAAAARRGLARAVMTPGPTLVVSPSGSDDHPDHRAVASCIDALRRPGLRRLAYPVWPAGAKVGGAARCS
ncbi:PIG-L family deacetylase [Sphingomonas sp. MMS24-JH45]